MSRVTTWVVALTVLCGLTATARAQEGFRAWVGLFDPVDVRWLENENRLGELCTDPATLAACHARSLGPKVAGYDLYQLPSEVSGRVGVLVVVATPGRGLSAHFRAMGRFVSTTFVPDLFLQDWGYGPYFHQTLAAEQDGWIRLPPGPWPTDVWLRRGPGGGFPIITVQGGDIIEMDDAGWYVVAAEPDALLLRPEQPADHWCEEGEPPVLQGRAATRFTRPQLLDAGGHLRFRMKYLKGC
ncbi:MAG: hypothetical protein OEM96_05770 [Gemmatimonadota bacterium]|nr:hypothetical protein [Gemmatimonadota bacterium]